MATPENQKKIMWLGLLLCLTGAGIPLGIGLIIAGMAGVHAADSISSNPITQWAKSLMNGVIGVFESGVNWIISMLDKVHFTVPSWVIGIGGKKYGINIQPVHIPRLATGGLITGPTYSLIGEGRDHEAVLPLNDTIYSRIGKGIRDNGGNSSGMDTDKIISRLDRLERAILDRPVELYTTDQKIAESANRGGNASIDRRCHAADTRKAEATSLIKSALALEGIADTPEVDKLIDVAIPLLVLALPKTHTAAA